MRNTVGIVGAGPIGMALAARLASFGVPTIVFERDPELRQQGSKACLVQGDALEVLDKFGVAEAIAARGLTWRTGHTYVRGREIRTDEYPARVGYGPFVNISQWDVERAIFEHLEQEPLCTIRWGHEVSGYEETPDGIVATTTDPDGHDRQHELAWLVACDGVHSSMRSLAGVTWTGYTHRDRFLITDLRCKLPVVKERHFHYDPPFNRGRQVVMHPQPDDVWRIDWQLHPDTDIEAEVESGEFDRRVRRVIGDIPYDVEWRSTYRFHQRVVDRFVVGRVIFAGDAAHAYPPYGSRGMNSGFQDADNLAWKLALVTRAQAGRELIESYHTERYAAAKENLRVTENTLRFMVPPTRTRHLLRRIALGLSRVSGGARRRIDSGRMAAPFRYTDSPIVATGNLLDGAFAPDGLLENETGTRRLRTLFGSDFVFVRFLGADPAPGIGLPACTVVDIREDVFAFGDGTWRDADGTVRAAFGLPVGNWALIRPDGHVAATGELSDVDYEAALAAAGASRLGMSQSVAVEGAVR